MEPLSLVTRVIAEVTDHYFRTRLMRRDFAFIIPVGVAYSIAYSLSVYALRALPQFKLVALELGNPFPLTPARLLGGAVIGMAVATVMAFAQVGVEGIPKGLTLGMAVAPPLVFGALLSVTALKLMDRTGSTSYAVAWLALSVLHALWVSLVLRRLRLR
jgi:hypothetical protein